MKYQITLMPSGQVLTADAGVTLLSALRQGHHPVDAPCGGQGKCQKCTVTIDGKEYTREELLALLNQTH